MAGFNRGEKDATRYGRGMSAVLDTPRDGMRPMFEDDIASVMAIETAVYDFPWTGGIFNDCLQVGYSSWVFQEQNKVIAYGVMSVAALEGHILTFAVHPERQGHGMGKLMLEHLIQIAKRQRVEKLFLEVRPTNPIAIALYEKNGFSRIGRRPDYYPAHYGREDAIVMVKDLLE